ncbi:MAG: 2,3-bisphosphoglycerate-independent phosphoglycerate mutase, partial [Nanoarchaeota archaeon]
MKTKKKVVLIVLDGWGISKQTKGNAILAAHANYFTKLQKENPHCILKASEESVGLKKGFIGNSEVGHLHIGAGRLVKQDLVRI